MTNEEIQLVIGALDTLGTALSDHGHVWTDGERAIYEEAIEACKRERVSAAKASPAQS
jgi:hypothetical protein